MPLIKLNDRSIKDVTSLPFGVGNLVLISSQTASNSASISFTTGINSTYKEYQFYFIDIHPRNDDVYFTFNLSTDGGSNYNVTKTTTVFNAYHDEADTASALAYRTGDDLAQGTGFQRLESASLGNGADESCAIFMQLFNPSSTTYVKHFISVSNGYDASNYSVNNYVAGYANTTSAINAVQFKMESGNFDGTIAMFGVL
jgi:hypothetical protein